MYAQRGLRSEQDALAASHTHCKNRNANPPLRRYHCYQCPDFDLCQLCYEPVTNGEWAKSDARFAHPAHHSFTTHNMDEDDEQRAKLAQGMKKLLLLLEKNIMFDPNHDPNGDHSKCPEPEQCRKIAAAVQHSRACKESQKTCKTCAKMHALYDMHAKACTNRGKCNMPFCYEKREKHRRLQRQQQMMDDRRRKAQNQVYSSNGAAPAAANPGAAAETPAKGAARQTKVK